MAGLVLPTRIPCWRSERPAKRSMHGDAKRYEACVPRIVSVVVLCMFITIPAIGWLCRGFKSESEIVDVVADDRYDTLACQLAGRCCSHRKDGPIYNAFDGESVLRDRFSVLGRLQVA